MMKKGGIKVAVVMSVLLAPLTSAHHSAFLYHLDTLDTAAGVLTEVEWINPHPAFYFDIADEEGRVTNWQLEGISPAFYSAKGFRGSDFRRRIGMTATVSWCALKNGLPNGFFWAAEFEDGFVARTGDAPDGCSVN